MLFLLCRWWTVLIFSVVHNVRSTQSASSSSSSSTPSDWSSSDFPTVFQFHRHANIMPRRGGGQPPTPSLTSMYPDVALPPLSEAIAEMQCALKLLGTMLSVCRMSVDIGVPINQQIGINEDDQAANVGSDHIGAVPVSNNACNSPLQAAARFCVNTFVLQRPSIFSNNNNPYQLRWSRLDEILRMRGRRQNTLSEYPPGFFASRGRRSNASNEPGIEQRDRKDDESEDPNFPRIYVKGFLGSRG